MTCVRRPAIPPEVGFVGRFAHLLTICFIFRFTFARTGMPVGLNRSYEIVVLSSLTSYMKPTSGGPHGKVIVGGSDLNGRPVPAAASANRSSPGGLIQFSRVSQRSLQVSP